VVWKERAKNRRKFSTPPIPINGNAVLQRKGDGNCHVYADGRWAILPSLLLADGGNLGISQWLSYTLLAVPSGCPIAFQSISQQLLVKTKQFLIIINEALFLHF
jgi:hypothetical protein